MAPLDGGGRNLGAARKRPWRPLLAATALLPEWIQALPVEPASSSSSSVTVRRPLLPKRRGGDMDAGSQGDAGQRLKEKLRSLQASHRPSLGRAAPRRLAAARHMAKLTLTRARSAGDDEYKGWCELQETRLEGVTDLKFTLEEPSVQDAATARYALGAVLRAMAPELCDEAKTKGALNCTDDRACSWPKNLRVQRNLVECRASAHGEYAYPIGLTLDGGPHRSCEGQGAVRPLPRELWSVTSLARLSLTSQCLTGRVEKDSLERLTHLVCLDLYHNTLQGELPNTGPLRRLASLRLSANRFTGPLFKKRLSTTLVELEVRDNQFSGAPNLIPGFEELRMVDIAYNNFSGNMPYLPKNVIEFHAESNDLSGMLADDLDLNPLAHPKLRVLDVSNNLFAGSLPTLLPGLTQFWAGGNELSGELEDMSSLDLQFLDLRSNSFHGPLPALPKTLVALFLEKNAFSGELPDMQAFSELQYLYLDENEFTGHIPILPPNLVYFTASSNMLSGTLSRLSGLHRLSGFELQYNELEGEIPDNCPELAYVHLQGNRLQGTLADVIRNANTHLQVLDLSENELHGELMTPGSRVEELEQLFELHLSTNDLEGPLPAKLFQRRGADKMTMLSLDENRLEGSLPPDLGNAVQMQSLVLNDNRFSGKIPDEIGKLTNLHLLDLSKNHFTGKIPEEIAACKGLSYILLEGNEFSGEIPPGLANLVELRHLMLQDNQFTGIIPTGFGQLRELEHLSLKNNRVHGPIPSALGGLSKLSSVDFMNNLLTGALPSSLSQLVNLKYFDVCYNSLSGAFNLDLTKLPHMEMLDVSWNSFSGELPGKMASGSLREMYYLDFSHNKFEGELPQNWRGMSEKMKVLDASFNQFSGELPQDIALLSGLFFFGVQDNMLSGRIPSWIGANLTALKFLDLGRNNFSGEIPANLAMLEDLTGLFLMNNNLEGDIPRELGKLTKLSYLILHDNQLDGVMPHMNLTACRLEICNNSAETVLTLHGNRLSCALPRSASDLVSPADADNLENCPRDGCFLKGTVALGNKFSLPIPDWLPEHNRDIIHFEKKYMAMWTAIIFAGGLTWLLMVVHILHRDVGTKEFFLRRIMRRPDPAEPTEAEEPPQAERIEVTAHRNFLRLLPRTCVLSLCGLAPFYYAGSRYTKCGDELSKFSITYLDKSPAIENVVGLLWFCHLVEIGKFVAGLPSRRRAQRLQQAGIAEADYTMTNAAAIVGGITRTTRRSLIKNHAPSYLMSILRRTLSLFAWMCILAVFTVLPVLWSLFKQAPSENTLSHIIGKIPYMMLYYSTPALNALLILVVLPMIASGFARRMQVPSAVLMALGHLVCYWAAPSMGTVFFSEYCCKNWRRMWPICDGNSLDLDIMVYQKNVQVLRTQDMCQIPPMEYYGDGRCSREIVETLTPLIFAALAIEAVLLPILYIFLWRFSELKEDGKLYLRYLKIQTSFECEDYFHQLNIWAGTTTFWGPLIPMLEPMVLLCAAVNLVNINLELHVFKKWADDRPEWVRKEPHVSKSYICFMILSFCAWAVHFCIITNMIWNIAACMATAIIIFSMIFMRHEVRTMQRGGNLQDDDDSTEGVETVMVPCGECVDAGRAIRRCVDCDLYLCPECARHHQRAQATVSHTLECLKASGGGLQRSRTRVMVEFAARRASALLQTPQAEQIVEQMGNAATAAAGTAMRLQKKVTKAFRWADEEQPATDEADGSAADGSVPRSATRERAVTAEVEMASLPGSDSPSPGRFMSATSTATADHDASMGSASPAQVTRCQSLLVEELETCPSKVEVDLTSAASGSFGQNSSPPPPPPPRQRGLGRRKLF